MGNSIRLASVNPDEEYKHLPEVTNYKFFEFGKYASNGLFSQQIFGPVKSFECACSKSIAPQRSPDDKKCKRCGVDFTYSLERRRRYAKIVLPFEIINPAIFSLFCSTKPGFKPMLQSILCYKETYCYDPDGKILRYDPETMNTEGYQVLEGLDGTIQVINRIIDANPDHPVYQYIKNNMNLLKIKTIGVLPPDLRPYGQTANGTPLIDEINKYYRRILIRTSRFNSMDVKWSTPDSRYKLTFLNVQKQAIELYEFVLSKLSKKKGLIRANILGKRVDFSGRAIISPSPSLTIKECGIPYLMILEMMKPQLTSYLVRCGDFRLRNMAYQEINKCIRTKDPSLFDRVTEFCKGRMCMLNRQPTLHRLGVLAFEMVPHLGNTILLHPMMCVPYNADFDGDSVLIKVRIRKGTSEIIHSHIMNIRDTNLFENIPYKTNNKIDHYKPKEDIFIESISPEMGDVGWKKITDYSVHKNLNMYKIEDPKIRFESFHSSEDHSLLVFDEGSGQIIKTSPKELIENPSNKYLIQRGTV
jgi:DNA-directed RNA polymerase subunit beta'